MDDVAIVAVGQRKFSWACNISIKELAFKVFKDAKVGDWGYL